MNMENTDSLPLGENILTAMWGTESKSKIEIAVNHMVFGPKMGKNERFQTIYQVSHPRHDD